MVQAMIKRIWKSVQVMTNNHWKSVQAKWEQVRQGCFANLSAIVRCSFRRFWRCSSPHFRACVLVTTSRCKCHCWRNDKSPVQTENKHQVNNEVFARLSKDQGSYFTSTLSLNGEKELQNAYDD